MSVCVCVWILFKGRVVDIIVYGRNEDSDRCYNVLKNDFVI